MGKAFHASATGSSKKFLLSLYLGGFFSGKEGGVGERSGTGGSRAWGSPRGGGAKLPHPIQGQSCLQATSQVAVPLL